MEYADADVSILKSSVPPGATLMSVANPWMLASPAPDTSHWLAGSPGFWFSQVTGLTVGPQALAAATCGCRGPLTAAAMSPAASNARTPIRRHTPTRILFAITL